MAAPTITTPRDGNGLAADGSRYKPKRRRPLPLLALGLACIAGSIALFIGLGIAVDSRRPVLALARDVPAGKVIEPADLKVVHIAADGVPSVAATERSAIVGKVAVRSLEAETLLGPLQVTASAPLEGQVVVGVALEPGRLPSGLGAGDHVRVVDTGRGESAEPAVLVVDAVVFAVDEPSRVSDTRVVSLTVPAADAARVASAAADRRVSLVLVSGAAR